MARIIPFLDAWKKTHHNRHIILETAVQDDKMMQDFDLESFAKRAHHFKKVNTAPIANHYSSKNYITLSSSTAVSRIMMLCKYLQSFRCRLTSFVFITFCLGYQQFVASDQAVLALKARMKVIRNVSLSYDDHFIKNPFRIEAKGLNLENLINVKITYNGYRPIKLILQQKKQPNSDAEDFAFYHELETVNKKINYYIYFNETKTPVIDGVIFRMDSKIINPIIDKQIGLDLYIPPFKGENCVAGKYATHLQLIIMEIE